MIDATGRHSTPVREGGPRVTAAGLPGVALLGVLLLAAPGCGGSREPSASHEVVAIPPGGPAAAPAGPAGGAAAADADKVARAHAGPVTATVTEVILSPAAKIQAERFKCVCGCDLVLAVCTCLKTPGSIDMKQHLQALVDRGLGPDEIREGMVAAYGPGVLP